MQIFSHSTLYEPCNAQKQKRKAEVMRDFSHSSRLQMSNCSGYSHYKTHTINFKELAG